MVDLADTLDRMTAPGELVETLPDGAVRCTRAPLPDPPGRRGICQVRFNREGELRVPRGYVAASQIDPIEKKPFSHVLPGSTALTFGMLGCDFHCGYCQNWLTSQALRDPDANESIHYVQPVSAERLVRHALNNGCSTVVSSYNEPLITSEWAVEIFKQAIAGGLQCAFVSNGNATPEALRYLRPYLTAYKVDLKSMQDKNYRKLGGVLQHVLDTIQAAHDLGLWVEVVTLVVPGFNDSPDELWEAARFLASVSTDIPWHVTAYHPDYKMDAPPTGSISLRQAAEIGQEAGALRLRGQPAWRVGGYEGYALPEVRRTLIERRGTSSVVPLTNRRLLVAERAFASAPDPAMCSSPAGSLRIRL
jgi:pyruvate formate lyase activating enzyme